MSVSGMSREGVVSHSGQAATAARRRSSLNTKRPAASAPDAHQRSPPPLSRPRVDDQQEVPLPLLMHPKLLAKVQKEHGWSRVRSVMQEQSRFDRFCYWLIVIFILSVIPGIYRFVVRVNRGEEGWQQQTSISWARREGLKSDMNVYQTAGYQVNTGLTQPMPAWFAVHYAVAVTLSIGLLIQFPSSKFIPIHPEDVVTKLTKGGALKLCRRHRSVPRDALKTRGPDRDINPTLAGQTALKLHESVGFIGFLASLTACVTGAIVVPTLEHHVRILNAMEGVAVLIMTLGSYFSGNQEMWFIHRILSRGLIYAVTASVFVGLAARTAQDLLGLSVLHSKVAGYFSAFAVPTFGGAYDIWLEYSYKEIKDVNLKDAIDLPAAGLPSPTVPRRGNHQSTKIPAFTHACPPSPTQQPQHYQAPPGDSIPKAPAPGALPPIPTPASPTVPMPGSLHSPAAPSSVSPPSRLAAAAPPAAVPSIQPAMAAPAQAAAQAEVAELRAQMQEQAQFMQQQARRISEQEKQLAQLLQRREQQAGSPQPYVEPAPAARPYAQPAPAPAPGAAKKKQRRRRRTRRSTRRRRSAARRRRRGARTGTAPAPATGTHRRRSAATAGGRAIRYTSAAGHAARSSTHTGSTARLCSRSMYWGRTPV